jgi:hypothetical protein
MVVRHMTIYGCMIWRVIRNMGYRLFGLFLDISPEPLPLFVCAPSRKVVDLDVDTSCRFMLTAGGNRGWGGATTEVVLGYDIGVVA